jgi:pyruvate dehydrogenase E1 component alpha subunit
MPIETVFSGEVKRLSILGPDGTLDEALAEDVRDVLTDDYVREIYGELLVCREFDEAAYRLQRSGRMGTFPQNKGQEAAALGPAIALRKGHDHIVPAYRENAALFHHGLPMHLVLLHWMGDERGNAIPKELCVSPICIEIGAQVLHGAGVAWAMRLQDKQTDDRRVCMTFFGDGATSEGDFHEGLNFASVMKSPTVFVCQNNGWAISVPTHLQSASRTFAQKALAYGMPTIQADGNDLFASYKAARDAVGHARAGNGPAFIELTTYRLADHTTADDASRYRPAGELEKAKLNDPLVRLRKFLEIRKLWDDDAETAGRDRAKKIVREVIEAATKIEKPASTDVFDHAFDTLPPELVRQRDTRRTSSLGQHPEQETLRTPQDAKPTTRELAPV